MEWFLNPNTHLPKQRSKLHTAKLGAIVCSWFCPSKFGFVSLGLFFENEKQKHVPASVR